MKECLAQACNNTFVIFDCLGDESLDKHMLHQAHQRLKEENRDDALLLVGGQVEGDHLSARMVVLGLDGELGEYCGNGARACAAYLFSHYKEHQTFALRTSCSSQHLSRLGENEFCVQLPPVRLALNPKFVTDLAQLGSCVYVEVIEPHLVTESAISAEELLKTGRELNQHKEMFPLGINVNACHWIDENTIAVTTYERGVQRFTKSCGTGSVASAVALRRARPELQEVRVMTPGGVLTIRFEENAISLCGEAYLE